ncbi:MAG: ATP-dependent DNA helicase RecQ [Deltaproteobacteria bacterium]|nr:ATP-dependent DNA helicase RecQ [Deltaproteobacteria bacterium]
MLRRASGPPERLPPERASAIGNRVTAPVPGPLDLESALRALGYESFRPGQREAIETILADGRLLLVAPTGGGKSLTYQLPASLLPGTTLVVSPLIALMNDQVRALQARGVAATYLASTVEPAEASRRLAALARGELKLVYVAPERLALAGFQGLLQSLSCPLVVIDEAHCISEWGHDFRPEYLQIGDLLANLPGVRVMACTATATPLVRDEILARLGLPPETPQILRGFARPNLRLRACELVGRGRERDAAVDALLAEALGSATAPRGAAIVYAPTRRDSEAESDRLSGLGWRAGAYHAGRNRDDREHVQTEFSEKRLDVVVATNAFGMGIDRADVRAVIHLAPPGSIEAYYQEVGRAGRDGEEAFGLLLVASDDPPRRRRLLEMDRGEGELRPEILQHKWSLYLELLQWAQGGSCRHDAILRYFGDEAETLHGCGRCDVCERLVEPDERDEAERTEIVRKALSAVARVSGRFGMRAAVNLLRGVKDDRLSRSGLDRTKTAGILAEHSDEWLMRLLGRFVTAGWVGFDGDERPLVRLTALGREVMRAERPARILLPPQTTRARPAGGRSRASRSAEVAASLDEAGARVFEALRAWRQSAARREGIPAYVVAHDRTLREIAELRPVTVEQLSFVWGFGPAKRERFGREIVEVVRGVA